MKHCIGFIVAHGSQERHNAKEKDKEQYKGDNPGLNISYSEVNRIVYAVHYHNAGKGYSQAFQSNGSNIDRYGYQAENQRECHISKNSHKAIDDDGQIL